MSRVTLPARARLCFGCPQKISIVPHTARTREWPVERVLDTVRVLIVDMCTCCDNVACMLHAILAAARGGRPERPFADKSTQA